VKLHVAYFRHAGLRVIPGRIEIEASRIPVCDADLRVIEEYVLSTYISSGEEADVIVVSSWRHFPEAYDLGRMPFAITEPVLADDAQPAAVEEWLGDEG